MLLLDEPLGALDLKLRKQMQLELKRIQTEVGITFVYVTHDQDEAMTMSDRIAVMRAGRIEQLGDPVTLYEHPATEFVAGFLGVSNLLDGQVGACSGERGRGRARPTARVVRVPTDGLAAGSSVRVGVRPEKLRVSAPERGAGDGPSNVNRLDGHHRRRELRRRQHAVHRSRDTTRRTSRSTRRTSRSSGRHEQLASGSRGAADLEARTHAS